VICVTQVGVFVDIGGVNTVENGLGWDQNPKQKSPEAQGVRTFEIASGFDEPCPDGS
jgi:hypothetical protein